MNTNRATVLALIIICLLLQTSGLYSQNDTSIYISNGDKYVAEQLFSKRIVMLGDFGHHTSISLHSLLQVLEAWYSFVEPGTRKCNLTLVLECNVNDAKNIETYINSGKTEDLLNAVSMLLNIEDLEYLSDLREFVHKVQSSEAYSIGMISFKIKGFESVGSTWSVDYAMKTNIEREKWFIEERDSMIAEGLLDYIKTKPDEKILMFYGNAHLQKELVSKASYYYIRTTNDSGMGYFLGHYLKKEFGDNNVLTVNQMPDPGSGYGETLPFNLRGNEAFVKSSIIPWKQFNPLHYDAYIFRKSYYRFLPHRLSFILSRSITERFLDYFKQMEIRDKVFFDKSFNQFYTVLLFGVSFTDSKALESWYNCTSVWLTPDSLGSDIIRDRLFDQFYKDTTAYRIETRFHTLGFLLETLFPIPDTAKWKNIIWPEALSHMKFIASVANFWIGDKDEKQQAKKYLISFSGEDFPEAVQYFKWYRKKYYHYDF
jgi:hypothetical protein